MTSVGSARGRRSSPVGIASAVVSLFCAAVMLACQGDPGYRGRNSREWIALLREGSAQERENAAVALEHVLAINPKLEPAITALMSALSDTSDAVRVAASRALSQPNVRAMDALPGLRRMLEDSAHAAVRAQGIRALGRLLASGSSAERLRILTVIVPAHSDADADVRAAVADAFGRASDIGERSAEVQSALMALVADPVVGTRLRAVAALGVISGPARRDALRIALRDLSRDVRTAALGQLSQDTIALAALQAEVVIALADTSARVRLAAVHALGVAPAASNAVVNAALRARLRDVDSTVRAEAAHAVSQFHARGGRDVGPEPSQLERCKQLPPRTRGC